jgi:DMSO reductase anchor subunit
MRPAWSVILLTTLLGAGQGLFLAVYAVEAAAHLRLSDASASGRLQAAGAVLSVGLLAAGLAASFFHLGRPERAWRAVAMWRTSWLSREVIVLPAFMACVALYASGHWLGWPAPTVLIGAVGVVLCLALFLCTGMIYACLKFLQEWHTPLTVLNFFLLGSASGVVLAAALAASLDPQRLPALAGWGAAATVAGLAGRVASLVRNARLRRRSSLQTALGIRHPRIRQTAQGFTGGSFNTREFFHGRTDGWLRMLQWGFLAGAFALPLALLGLAVARASPLAAAAAFVVQYAGLLAERWHFFAQANHPQNLYYQRVS